jgi:hypothetical protein
MSTGLFVTRSEEPPPATLDAGDAPEPPAGRRFEQDAEYSLHVHADGTVEERFRRDGHLYELRYRRR